MPIVYGNSSKYNHTDIVKRSKDDSLRKQLNQILQAKKQLSIQMQHWERIKRITKDPKDLADIDQKLNKIRIEFLKFGSENF
ncbi:se116 [Alphabaculovirus alterspexiguae]|uniref:Se116 n=1 Tax=Spodoptera exigua multiple nucleopolyhedrovirus TaxID=10454 RepID=A0A3G2JU60_9ABAC|nr:se116 [Spodoptera exigua multiple nucleopolyhedrovirus]AYN45076.1 se116 [Spodoptera exigua multiple nucleopolyhedrovirus]